MSRKPYNVASPDAPNRIRYWRLQRGLTIEQLADAVGMPVQTVQRYETGERPLRDVHFPLFAAALNVDPTDLVPSNRPALSEEARRIAERFHLLEPHVRQAIRALADPGEGFEPAPERKTRDAQ
jgi:transcriptional regulator with XRE-family HTH domain